MVIARKPKDTSLIHNIFLYGSKVKKRECHHTHALCTSRMYCHFNGRANNCTLRRTFYKAMQLFIVEINLGATMEQQLNQANSNLLYHVVCWHMRTQNHFFMYCSTELQPRFDKCLYKRVARFRFCTITQP